MRSFLLVWFGQLISVVGSALTSFALGVWVYLETGEVTRYSLTLLAATLPGIIVAPFAGSVVDRWDRRLLMIVSDSGAAIVTVAVALLFFSGRIEVWHLYPLLGLGAVARGIQIPAYAAVTASLVPKQQLVRAGGLTQTAQALAFIIGPAMGGWLLGLVEISGVIAIDLVTFLFAIVTLLLVHIPVPAGLSNGARRHRSLLADAADGWQFVRRRTGLISLLLLFAVVNFSLVLIQTLITPLVLGFAGPPALGYVISIGSIGMLVGGAVISAWREPMHKVHGILAFGPLLALGIVIAGLRPSTVVVAAGLFGCMFSASCINALSQAIWQLKTPAEMHGRVFATRMLISWSCTPIAYLLAGPLADQVFEPLLRRDGILAGTIGCVLGTGAGRGIGLLFVITGLISVLVSAWAWAVPALRLLEKELPDAIPAFENR